MQKFLCGKALFLSRFAAQVFFLCFCLPLPLCIQGTHGEQDVRMRVVAIRIMDRQIGAHPLVDTFLLQKGSQKPQPILLGKFHRQGNDELTRQAAVPGFLGGLYCFP